MSNAASKNRTADNELLAKTAPSGTLFLVAAALLWSLNGLLIKHLDDAGAGSGQIAAMRSLFAAVVLAPVAIRRWQPIRQPGWTFGAVLMFTGMCATFVAATTLTTAANAIILQYTAPAWVFLLSPWIVGEKTEKRQWIAFALSMTAVAIIFGMQFTSDRVGLSVGLASGFVFGLQCVLYRKVRELDPVQLAFLSCLGSALLLIGPAIYFGRWSLTPATIGLIAAMGAVQFGLPYVLYAAGARRATAQQAVLIVMLEPVLNPLLVYIVRGEEPHRSTIVGGAFILVSVILMTLPSRRAVPAA